MKKKINLLLCCGSDKAEQWREKETWKLGVAVIVKETYTRKGRPKTKRREPEGKAPTKGGSP